MKRTLISIMIVFSVLTSSVQANKNEILGYGIAAFAFIKSAVDNANRDYVKKQKAKQLAKAKKKKYSKKKHKKHYAKKKYKKKRSSKKHTSKKKKVVKKVTPKKEVPVVKVTPKKEVVKKQKTAKILAEKVEVKKAPAVKKIYW